ncbi:tryptophan 7-halogenase [Sphingomonas sp. SM33]|uniref:Tryptophan 7-halogenase n=1 Tax=Sphingomonas telluris TaxID=2907998 RepID=A0ABS9VLB7_9SPHN|nr:tryptophan halogenase family protein [Sphingomonas telluris]MCH8615760.1 tryptophan 7-halogenase [Sphingomonas telluris]
MVVGGGTAGWLSAAYLAKALALRDNPHLTITLLESPDIGIVGVGEGTFPTIRETLRFLDIDERKFIRESSATFKQGILFADWLHEPTAAKRHCFFHPFEAPFYSEETSLVPYWLLQDENSRPSFAEAVTIQNRVAGAKRGPKRPGEPDFDGPLNYAYHIDAHSLARLLSERAKELGVVHVLGEVEHTELGATGAIDRVALTDGREIDADLYVDCSGFRAELIGRALGSPFRSVRDHLFTNKAAACKVPYDRPDAPIESYTLANAHEGGWTWDIGLSGARGIGCVYSSDHVDDERAVAILRDYIGAPFREDAVRILGFEPGYREKQWVKNCVSVGLSAGFLEPLEATGLVLIEAAVGMIAELFPHYGPVDAPARRFNQLMAARFENIVKFLKLHYCLSKREEAFWRENSDPATIPEELQELLAQWRYRPPGRFDFILDVESFAFFNYQYILYGMGFQTDLSAGRSDFSKVAAARRLFERIQAFGEKAARDLPSHRALVSELTEAA